MAKPLVTDEMWAQIEPLLRGPKASFHVGRPRLTDRSALTGILFVLKSGMPWEQLPREMDCGCGMTCLRRLREWQASNVWDEIHEVVVKHYPWARKLDWARIDNHRHRIRTSAPGHLVGAGRSVER